MAFSGMRNFDELPAVRRSRQTKESCVLPCLLLCGRHPDGGNGDGPIEPR